MNPFVVEDLWIDQGLFKMKLRDFGFSSTSKFDEQEPEVKGEFMKKKLTLIAVMESEWELMAHAINDLKKSRPVKKKLAKKAKATFASFVRDPKTGKVSGFNVEDLFQ